MGCTCCRELTDEEKAQQDINRNMNEAYRVEKRTHRILLLGPGDSGKSTIIKQMKKIHHKNIAERELKDYISVIRTSILKNMQTLCANSVMLTQRGFKKCEVADDLEDIRNYFLEEGNNSIETDETIPNPEYILKLWNDDGIRNTFANRAEFHIPESASYFFDRFEAINKEDYFPSFDDYLRFRLRTSGISRENFTVELHGQSVPFEIIDVGGQRSERKKWLPLIAEDIKAALYIFSVGEYDKFLFEDNNVLRLEEALRLFKDTIKQGYFEGKACIVFLNKYDLFEKRIKEVPITKAFDDFPEDQDPNDCDTAINFVIKKFNDLWQAKYKNSANACTMHLTSALDTDLVSNLMHDIQLNMVRNMLDKVGLN